MQVQRTGVTLRKRRRYNVGRYVRKKYPMRRSVKPYGKSILNNSQSVRCTSSDKITMVVDGTYRSADTIVGGVAQKYRNLVAMLGNSTEFQTRINEYSFYKVTGLAVKFTRRWLDPISYGVDGGAVGITANTYHFGFPMLHINFYPTTNTQSFGAIVENAESSWAVSPYTTGVQSHFIKMPTLLTGNGLGLNMWNPTNIISSLQGQLSFYNDPGVEVSDTTLNFIVWDVEYDLYIQFANNTGV